MDTKETAELSNADLEAVTGGASDTIYLNEENLPAGWYVTCPKCTLAFPVSEGSCPVCGGMEVLHGTSSAVYIYDPNKGTISKI